MPRRRETNRNRPQAAPSTFGLPVPVARPGQAPQPVMSVSAAQHQIIDTVAVNGPGSTDQASSGEGTRSEIMISPRVLDQRAFDELSSALRALIDEARQAEQALTANARQRAQDDEQASRCSQQLQERLHLCARMLKAMQSQAAALEQAAARAKDADERDQAQITRIESEIETRIGRAVNEAIERLNREARAKEQLLEAMDQRLEELLPRAERLGQLVESAEVNIAALAHRSAAGAQRAEQTAASLIELADRAQRHGRELAEQFNRVGELKAVLDEVDAVNRRWRDGLESVHRAEAESNIRDPFTTITVEPKLLDHSVPTLVRELRASIAHDMQRLSTAVSAIASRVDQLQARAAASDNDAPRVEPQPGVRSANKPVEIQDAGH